MDGIINVLKPPGMTSFDVIGYLRRILKMSKIGHAGTLDPGAVGVLPVFVGKATKAIEYVMQKDKLYRAELTLGIETTTQDSYGEILATSNVDLTHDRIESAIKSFEGKQQQIPPMYSAIKINGKKLYELAREGVTINRKPREIEIYNLNILKISENNKIIFDISCSKGTYIRTLCADIGSRLGCGGHMSFLVRLGAGNFSISDSVTLEELKEAAESNVIDRFITSVDNVFENFGEVILAETDEKKLLNGCLVKCRNDNTNNNDILRVYNNKGRFLALGRVIKGEEGLLLKSEKVFL